MRRRWTLAALGVAALLSAAMLYTRRFERVPPVDPQAPLHYFIAREQFARDELRCDFTLGLDRRRLHDVWSLPLQPCRLGHGWSVPTTRGVMAYAKRAEVEFFVDHTDWTHLLLRVKAVSHPTEDRVQKISARLNDQRLSTVEIPRGWRTVAIEIPPEKLRRGLNTFSFSFAYRAASTTSRTHHRFAIRLREIALAMAPPPRGPLAKVRRRFARSAPDPSSPRSPQVFDRMSGRFVVPTAGTLVMPMDLPATADRVEFSVEGPESRDRGRSRLAVSVHGLSDGASYSQELAIAEESADRLDSARRYLIPVDQFAGQPAVLALELRLVPGDAPFEISVPKLIMRPLPTHDDPDPQRRAAATDQPDIVIITLDAARPDHFSCYGYERLTTPNIDRLAEESLVFTNVFALVPNTHQSVPTIVTGLSFLNHGVTEKESVLAQSAKTLAEYLRDAGYRTACFTATPNNSRSIGTEQGYDEFYELWTEVPRAISRTPDYLAARAVGWIDARDDLRPLHLQLHFVPPHAPYDPATEFDLFTDEAYDGALDGHPKTLQAIDKKNLAATDSDLAHIISLYDGNLRAADHAVEKVLQALKSRPRWNDTVVLVTSDHGEAFSEHGRMLHNNTVYDEMLRVPFILRVPRAVDRNGLDLERMATLADIVPTLLATASMRPAAPLDGVNLLEITPGARATGDRAVVARTAHPVPLRCQRTPRWKVILTPSGQGELYDLAADPGEQRNVAFEYLPVFVGLGQLLTRRLMAPPRIDRSAREEDLPDEEREMLKTLGYLE
jgi:arylsulfatase